MINRKKYCIANFKMNKTAGETQGHLYLLEKSLTKINMENILESKHIIIICPPLTSVADLTSRYIRFGVQNIHERESGAYTGEISASMLEGWNVDYVILGHSERRAYFNESDEQINKKINLACKHHLTPIFCIGETLDQRQNDLMEKTLRDQLVKGLNGIEDKSIILAYEPVWAIGTGKSATCVMIAETHKMIRNILNDIGFDGKKISILYGGSVNRNNAEELIKLEDVDGFLIGGASLDAKHFYDIYKFIEESI